MPESSKAILKTDNGNIVISPEAELPLSPLQFAVVTLTFQDGTVIHASIDDINGLVQNR